MRHARPVWVAAFLAMPLSGAGCGPPKEAPGVVAGRVTCGGKPVTAANIVFQRSGSSVAVFVPLGDDGRYTARTYDCDGLPAGTYQVAVLPGASPTDGPPPLVGEARGTAAKPVPIPARFHDVRTSGLAIEVQPGSNPAFDFDLAK